MSFSVAHTVLFILENMNPPGVLPASTSGITGHSEEPDFKVSSLELFGRAQENTGMRELINAPETRLNLELQGVFLADDEARSTTIIGEKNKKGELYSIGDSLPGNATLAAVFGNHVLLRRGARVEKLMFPDSQFRALDGTTDQGAMPDPQKIHLQPIHGHPGNLAAPIPGAAGSSGAASRLSEYHRKFRQDPQSALSEIGLAPVSEDGARGYRVGSDAQPVIMQAGLQPGDLILSVNGRPVGAATSDSALMEEVMASSRVRVEVRRGSRRFFLTLPVPG